MIGPTHRIPPPLWNRMPWSARARFIDTALLDDLKAQAAPKISENAARAERGQTQRQNAQRNRDAITAHLAANPDATNTAISAATGIAYGTVCSYARDARKAAA